MCLNSKKEKKVLTQNSKVRIQDLPAKVGQEKIQGEKDNFCLSFILLNYKRTQF